MTRSPIRKLLLQTMMVLSSAQLLSCKQEKANRPDHTASLQHEALQAQQDTRDIQRQIDSNQRLIDSLDLVLKETHQRQLAQEKASPSREIGFVADLATQLHNFNEIVDNGERFIGKEYTWKATIFKRPDGNMFTTKDGGLLLCVGGMFPDGIICAYDEKGNAWNASAQLPRVSAGCEVVFTGKLAGVSYLKAVNAPFAVFAVRAARVLSAGHE